MDQPDYLILNTPCGQVSLYPWQDAGPSPKYAVGLTSGSPPSATAGWVTPAESTPPGARSAATTTYRGGSWANTCSGSTRRSWRRHPRRWTIVHHHIEAIEHRGLRDGRERVLLANGEYLDVDHVILTSGHTGNVEPDANPALIPRPYPVDRYTETIPRGATVAVEGMGLVATDVVIALTVGRGGSFTESGDRLRYRELGRRTDTPALLPQRIPLLLEGGRDRGRERRVRGRRLHQGGDRGDPGRSSNGAGPGARSTFAPRCCP